MTDANLYKFDLWSRKLYSHTVVKLSNGPLKTNHLWIWGWL